MYPCCLDNEVPLVSQNQRSATKVALEKIIQDTKCSSMVKGVFLELVRPVEEDIEGTSLQVGFWFLRKLLYHQNVSDR